MDCDGFVMSIRTQKLSKGPPNLKNSFDFSNLNKNLILFSNKNKKVVRKFKIETPIKHWIDELISLRRKAYFYRCGGENINIMKIFSKSESKMIKFDDCFSCLFGSEHQKESDNYVTRSIKHDMRPRKKRENTISAFDGK